MQGAKVKIILFTFYIFNAFNNRFYLKTKIYLLIYSEQWIWSAVHEFTLIEPE